MGEVEGGGEFDLYGENGRRVRTMGWKGYRWGMWCGMCVYGGWEVSSKIYSRVGDRKCVRGG